MRRGLNRLDLRDTLALKGLAIAAITLHNYYHLLGPVKENEFEFTAARFTVFLQTAIDPRQTVQALFSFLGHYGVQVFIFLSAYGLAVRHWDLRESWSGFVWSRVRKIYPMFFLAAFAWALYMALGGMNPLEVLRKQVGMLALTALGVETVIPGYGLPPVGPWWFLPFIVQFYCLWPLLRRLAARYEKGGLIALSCASLVVTYLANDALAARWSINLFETPVGHMPELCLGIWAARYGFQPGWKAGLLGGAAMAAGNAMRVLWPLSFTGALLFALWLYGAATGRRGPRTAWQRLGNVSMALFFVNGFIRMPFIAIAEQGDWARALALGFVSAAFSLLVAWLLYGFEQRLRNFTTDIPDQVRTAVRR